MLHDKLIFVIGSPRSGSTLLQRLLGSHSQIFTHPEPHLLTPLAYLGYYDTVEKAPYDHVNAALALREFAEELPRGEADYLDALRAYASTLYERVLSPSGKAYFLDKTPAYALVLPFVTKLYPQAKYVVLTRHPLAIMHSVAHSFFGGDYAAAEAANPIVKRYVPAIGSFILEQRVPHVLVRYEDVVQQPARELGRICAHLGVPFEPSMVEYGAHEHISKSYGDPMSVERHQRPVTDSLETWAQDLLARPTALALARQVIDGLDPTHLAAWGYAKETLFAALERQQAVATRRSPWNTYRFKRRLLLALRKLVQRTPLALAVRKVRYLCDLLLRA